MLIIPFCGFFSGLIGCMVFVGLGKIFCRSPFKTLEVIIKIMFVLGGIAGGYLLNQRLCLLFPADRYEIEKDIIEPVKSSDGHETAYIFTHKNISGKNKDRVVTIVQFVQKIDNILRRRRDYYKENEIWNRITFLPEGVDRAFVQVKKTYKSGVWGLFLMYPDETTFFVPAHGIKDGEIQPRTGYEFVYSKN